MACPVVTACYLTHKRLDVRGPAAACGGEVCLPLCLAALIAAQSFVSAQQLDLTRPGELYGYIAAELDNHGVGGDRVWRIRMIDGVTVALWPAGVTQSPQFMEERK